jgi:NADH-quinone oxidoreductase subunit A
MLQMYLPILVFIVLAILFGIVPLIAGAVIRPKLPYKAKTDPYECGFDPFEDARLPFDVKFYLVAILFIIFDLETAFLFPWAVVMRHLGWYGIAAMGIFVGLLIIGFIYEWKKGALEWE